MSLIAGTSSTPRSLRSPTRRDCCPPISSVPTASASPRRPAAKNGLPDYVKLRNVAAPKKAEHGVRRLKTVTSRWRSRTAQGCRPPFVGSEPAHQSDSELHPAPYGYLGAPKPADASDRSTVTSRGPCRTALSPGQIKSAFPRG